MEVTGLKGLNGTQKHLPRNLLRLSTRIFFCLKGSVSPYLLHIEAHTETLLYSMGEGNEHAHM